MISIYSSNEKLSWGTMRKLRRIMKSQFNGEVVEIVEKTQVGETSRKYRVQVRHYWEARVPEVRYSDDVGPTVAKEADIMFLRTELSRLQANPAGW